MTPLTARIAPAGTPKAASASKATAHMQKIKAASDKGAIA